MIPKNTVIPPSVIKFVKKWVAGLITATTEIHADKLYKEYLEWREWNTWETVPGTWDAVILEASRNAIQHRTGMGRFFTVRKKPKKTKVR